MVWSLDISILSAQEGYLLDHLIEDSERPIGAR
jgi:hypothetical protein